MNGFCPDCGENLQTDNHLVWCTGDQCPFHDSLTWRRWDGTITAMEDRKECDWVTANNADSIG